MMHNLPEPLVLLLLQLLLSAQATSIITHYIRSQSDFKRSYHLGSFLCCFNFRCLLSLNCTILFALPRHSDHQVLPGRLSWQLPPPAIEMQMAGSSGTTTLLNHNLWSYEVVSAATINIISSVHVSMYTCTRTIAGGSNVRKQLCAVAPLRCAVSGEIAPCGLRRCAAPGLCRSSSARARRCAVAPLRRAWCTTLP